MINYLGIKAIYIFEINRAIRTIGQTILAPVISTALYFVIFGSAIGERIGAISGIEYGAFIVPGLIMLAVLSQSVSNASFGIYFPRYIGTIYQILSAPLSAIEIVIGYVGAAATKSFIIGITILFTAKLFVSITIQHPFWMMLFLFMSSITFSLFGFVIGIWANNFEKLNIFPALIINPLIFLGGSFYSISMLPELWQKIALLNPAVYLISGFRWSFYGYEEINIMVSIGILTIFWLITTLVIYFIFKTGYKLKK